MTELFAHLQFFLAVLVRTSGLLIAIPVIGGKDVPRRIKALLAICVAGLMFTTLSTGAFQPARTLLGFTAIAAGELAVGLAIGFVSMLTFGALQIAGELASRQMGFALANIVDPTLGQQVSLIGRFNVLLATIVLLSINGHHWFLQALRDSFGRIPIGGINVSGNLCHAVFSLFTTAYVAGIKLAAPLVCAFLLITIAVGILARVAPQLNVMMLGISLRIGVGLIALGFFMPYLAVFAERLMIGMRRDMYLLIEAMRG